MPADYSERGCAGGVLSQDRVVCYGCPKSTIRSRISSSETIQKVQSITAYQVPFPILGEEQGERKILRLIELK